MLKFNAYCHEKDSRSWYFRTKDKALSVESTTQGSEQASRPSSSSNQVAPAPPGGFAVLPIAGAYPCGSNYQLWCGTTPLLQKASTRCERKINSKKQEGSKHSTIASRVLTVFHSLSGVFCTSGESLLRRQPEVRQVSFEPVSALSGSGTASS